MTKLLKKEEQKILEEEVSGSQDFETKLREKMASNDKNAIIENSEMRSDVKLLMEQLRSKGK